MRPRKSVFIYLIFTSLLINSVTATTFHGDFQRTGNFTQNSSILPVIEWKTYISGLVGSSPVFFKGNIFVSNWYGWSEWNTGLYCLNATDGSIKWRNDKITGASSVAVNTSGDFLFVGALNGKLYAVRVDDGEIIWSKKLERNPQWWGIASSPLIYNGQIYVTTFSDSTLHALDFSGNEIWSFSAGGETSPYSSPAAYGGKIFFGGSTNEEQTRLYCLDEEGNVLWSVELKGKIASSPSVGYNSVFIATETNLYAITLDGNVVWSIPFSGTMSTPALAYGRVYVGSKEGLYCIDAKTGKIEWKFITNGKIDSSPAVAGKYVYFATNTPEGTIYALNATSGKLIWYYRLKPPSGYYYNIMSSPFITDGRMFIGADSGYVYSFSSKGKISLNVTVLPGDRIMKVGNVTHEVPNTTVLGVLLSASEKGISGDSEISFNVEFRDYQVFSVFSMFDIECNWSCLINDRTVKNCMGTSVKEGDNLQLFCDSPESSPVLEINLDITETRITSFITSDGERGGYLTSWITLTVSEDGWYVVVVSGTNQRGDAIAGVGTVFLAAGQSERVPVIVHIPQEIPAGTYTLYAGVYRLSEFPDRITSWSRSSTSMVR